MRSVSERIGIVLNGLKVEFHVDPGRRLADVLRDDLGMTGTKIGCNAGDCGACTVLLDGRPVCACLIAAGRIEGREVATVEGLAATPEGARLQRAILQGGGVQCGICTPGMLMAAVALLRQNARPGERETMDALGGVLCRCTGYRRIIDAVMSALTSPAGVPEPIDHGAVGTRFVHVDSAAKANGKELFGADVRPPDACLAVRALRSPHSHARFRIGDCRALSAAHPGLVRILTASDVPGRNLYGIYPEGKDQTVLADGYVRHRGEAYAALVGDEATLAEIADADVPVNWDVLADVTFDNAAHADALHAHAPGNVLCRGHVARGQPDVAILLAQYRAEIVVETGFVEHAYIEPEAGYARRVGDRIEIVASTQTPYMDRDEIAPILGITPEQVRVIPTAVGGGFGGKLDLSVQPLTAVASWLTGQPVRMVWSRPESLRASTKRHPARIHAEAACDDGGRLVAFRFHGDFDTGAYASWGPTVANRVPVHATGPYAVPHVSATTAAIHTNGPPSGAFRGFGVPQAAIAAEALMDALAARTGIDPLEFRAINALGVGSVTATGQVLGAGAALPECLAALRPRWRALREEADAFNAANGGKTRRGAGMGCMWYGIGNTSLANPSHMVVGITPAGRAVLLSGAVDIGQGSNTVMVQIAAEALGIPARSLGLVAGDTDATRDAGKTSASRQTFVSGNAARLAGEALRRRLHDIAGTTGPIELRDGRVFVGNACIDPSGMAIDADGFAVAGEGRFDPPTTLLDASGQGVPYASYAFAAQAALVEVDVTLGTTKVLRIVAAHDVGRAINPMQVEGQIHGGIAQGLGLALMEEYIPGRTENLHDYLIPTIGDVPPIETILIEHPDPLGPYGAKGVGEPALVATAPAILAAIHHATGARITRIPATPPRVMAALSGLPQSRGL